MSVENTRALADLAARSGDWPALSALWDADQSADGRAERWEPILAQCAQGGHEECCRELGRRISREAGRPDLLANALSAAAKRGFWKACQELIGQGADAQAGDSQALVDAARGGWERAGETLLKAGADPKAQGGAALTAAAQKGLGGLVRALARRGADLGANRGEPLALAARSGAVEAVLALLEEGADAAANDSFALREAARAGHATVCHALVEAGAKIGAKHNEALRLALEAGKEKTIAALIRDGANWDDKEPGRFTQTAREWAFDPVNEEERGAAFVRRLSDSEWDKERLHRLLGGAPREVAAERAKARPRMG